LHAKAEFKNLAYRKDQTGARNPAGRYFLCGIRKNFEQGSMFSAGVINNLKWEARSDPKGDEGSYLQSLFDYHRRWDCFVILNAFGIPGNDRRGIDFQIP